MNKINSFEERNYKKNEYIKIKSLYVNKKYKALQKEATKYLEKFPDDINVRFMRAKTFRYLNLFDEAINDLKYNLSFGYDCHSLTELYYIYYYLNMYNEALELLPSIYENKCINAYSASITELVMKKTLGMNMKIKKGANCDYIRYQILNYDKSIALEHINQHINENINSMDNMKSCFSNNVDIEYLFELVRQNIDNSKKVNTEEILEIHYFAVNNIGYINEFPCNFIKVIVIPNTNNIINMYPTIDADYNYISNLDCDYSKLFKSNNEKVKSNSQIEKFNKKYKRV